MEPFGQAVTSVAAPVRLLLAAAVALGWFELRQLASVGSAGRWWAASAGDLANVGGLALGVVALHACGVPWAAALLLAGIGGIVQEALPRAGVFGVLVVLLAVAVAPGPALGAANAVARSLFPS